jgi:hypothetical protein
MIGGSTPKHTFRLPFDTSMLSNVRIVYAQGDEILITREKDGCTFDGNTIEVTLTQEETLKLDYQQILEIQGHFLTLDGNALVSKPKRMTVDKFLDREVLV